MKYVLFLIILFSSFGCYDWREKYDCADYELERVNQAFDEAYYFADGIELRMQVMWSEDRRSTVLENIQAVQDYKVVCAYFAYDAPTRAQVNKYTQELILPVAENIDPYIDPYSVTEEEIDECYRAGGREFMVNEYPQLDPVCFNSRNWGMDCLWSCPLIERIKVSTSATANLVSDIVHEGGHVAIPGLAHACEDPVPMTECPSGRVIEDEVLVVGTAAGIEVQRYMTDGGNRISAGLVARYTAEE